MIPGPPGSLRRRPVSNALVLIALVLSCSTEADPDRAPAGSAPKQAPEVGATRVEAAIFEGGTAVDRLVRPGEVVGVRSAKLAAALGGYVERVLVESGQRVKKNQVIARIDTQTHAAQLALARVELEDARRELARLETMGKAVARVRVDAARTRVELARAQERLALTQLSRATIRAPFAGVLVDLQLERGEVAASGRPIGRLLVLDPIRVSVSVSDRDIGTLSVGDIATVKSAGSPDPLEGRIERIEPAADLQTRTFLVEVDVPNPEQELLPGMIASVEFRRQGMEEVLLLPQELLVTQIDGTGVFTIDTSSIARWRPLTLGDVVGDQVEISSGLARGERIVTTGHRDLSDGDPVIVARLGICCPDGEVYYGPNGSTALEPPATTGYSDPGDRGPAIDDAAWSRQR